MNVTKHLVKEKSDTGNCENCCISDISVFNKCSHDIKSEITKRAIKRVYNKGEALVEKESKEGGIFCIQKGTVKIAKEGNRKKEFILWIAEAGDVIGLNSFIDNESFSFSACANEKVTACFLSASDLSEILKKEPEVTIHLVKNMCEKLDLLEQRITSISRKKIKEQCAEILISLATVKKSGNDDVININYSVNDLANLVGTTKNYLYKIILEFTKQKIISVNKRKLTINNLDALLLIAKGMAR